MNLSLPPLLESKLSAFLHRVWRLKLLEGTLRAVAALSTCYLLVLGLDRLMETPAALRGFLLAAGAAALLLGLPFQAYRWIWKQRSLEDAARLLRRSFPKLGDQLLGIVELTRASDSARSERLVQAAIQQATDAVKDKDFSQAVPNPSHRFWAAATSALLALSFLALGTIPEAAQNAFARWLKPWEPIERYTFAKILPLPKHLVIPASESFTLPIQLHPQTRLSPVSATTLLPNLPSLVSPLSSGSYQVSIPPQKDDLPLRLRLGDLRQSLTLLPRPRPELTELAVLLRLPDYLRYQTQPRLLVRGASIPLLKGSQAALEAKVNRPLAAAFLDDTPQHFDTQRILTEFTPVDASQSRRLSWRDTDGLSPKDPLLLKIQAVEDEPPRIAARKESLESVILDSEVVRFDLSSSDDFGVQRVGLEWKPAPAAGAPAAERSSLGEKISAAGAPEKTELTSIATFCATREGVAPQSLEIRAWSEDYLPGRKRTYSPPFVVHILNKADHALWLTEQLSKWLGAARESYDREQQLHQANHELRQLSQEDLDRPENRRRIAQQAAAETSNAARLDSLTQSGRRLVELATRNDEFDAPRLESWATMVQSLKDIAANRMPSVAGLLKQSSNAATAPQLSTPNSTLAPTGNASPSAAPSKPVSPSLTDRESSLASASQTSPPPSPSAPASTSQKPAPLKLPQTVLAAAPSSKPEEAPSPTPPSPAQDKLDTALTEQKDLLNEFSKVANELDSILKSLETSTFVKRLKAASRDQIKVAKTLSQSSLPSFGLTPIPSPDAEALAQNAQVRSDFVKLIQSDLDAYNTRKQDDRFKKILLEMQKSEVVRSLALAKDKLHAQLHGQTFHGAEYWADTLDRWAEEMVAASKCKASSSCSSESLPPEIVLKVMQALREEMQLRDQTREAEDAKPALEANQYSENAKLLETKQRDIASLTRSAADDILKIPEATAKFGKELRLLGAVFEVMQEATALLATPNTGAPTIAAETEAIELLLQAKRPNPRSGGSGGSSPGGGGTAAAASSAALAHIGPGSDAASSVAARPIGQTTGRAGKEFPAEFKSGLDAYFNRLEAAQK